MRDTGIGIPEEKQEQLFSSFTQADPSTTREHGGTGLGLSISKQLVDAMGGDIWVDSEEGKGSTFHFTIRAPRSTDLPSNANEPAAPSDGSVEGCRLLIVDDHETNRRLLLQLADAWGMEATTATSGHEALAKIEDDEMTFDLALLDVQMPTMDGQDLAQRIRQRPEYKDLSFIMLSSIHRASDPQTNLENSVWLRKPVKKSKLYEAVVRSLGFAATDDCSEHRDERHGPPAQRILLAEDEPTNREMTVQMLEKMGHEVDAAANGREVLEAVREQTYEVILMDVQMPEMDGLEATRRLREEQSATNQPVVIALTAAVTEEDRDRCEDAGMDAFLSKPIEREELTRMIASWSIDGE